MKKYNVLVNKFLLLALMLGMMSVARAQNVNIPDANFKAALLAHDPVIDTNDDDEIQVSEAEAFTGHLNVFSKDISNATGLSSFINITKLDIGSNASLSTLDITTNTKLTNLRAFSLSLSTINLSQNTLLDTLFLLNNNLTSIDLSNNPDLLFVQLANNQLTTLDISNNISLEGLAFQNNNVSSFLYDPSAEENLEALAYGGNPFATSFDFSGFSNLKQLVCNTSGLTSLDVSMLSNLEVLAFNDNPITSIDLSQNTALKSIQASNTSILELDLSSNINLEVLTLASHLGTVPSKIEAINLANGNNDKIASIFLSNNPDLSCIKVDNASDPFPNVQFITLNGFDNFVETVCEPGLMSFIDPAMEAALLAHTPAIDTDGSGAIVESEVAAFNGTLNLSNKGIKTLAGLEGFTGITGINLSDNQIKTLDLSVFPSITTVNVSNNNLTVFKMDNGTNASISFFDASGNTNLSCITVDDVTYSQTNWTSIPAGTGFSTDCIIEIPNSAVKAILNAYTPDIDLNDDGEIQTSEAFGFTDDLNISVDTDITDLIGIEAFINITYLQAVNNNLLEVDLTQNTSLQELRLFNNNNLAQLDLSTLKNLESVFITSTSLEELDVSNNPELTYLNVGSNDLTYLDLSNNKKLEELYASNNKLRTVDFPTSDIFHTVSMMNNNLISLDLSPMTGYSSVLLTNNFDLQCVKVHSIAYATPRVGTSGGAPTYFSEEDCPPVFDPAIRGQLTSHNPVIDIDDDDVIELDEILAFDGTLRLSGISEENLINLDLFSNITGLNLTGGENDVLDLTNYPNLNYLRVHAGEVPDFSSNTNLTKIELNFNNLSSIDLSNNVNLDSITITKQPSLSSLNLSANTALVFLEVFENGLTSLDLSGNSLAIDINAQNNPLISMDVTQNASLEILNLNNTSLSSIDLSNNASLKRLLIPNTESLTSLDLSNNTALEFVNASGNDLTSITFGESPNLVELSLDNNSLTIIDVSLLSGLRQLELGENQLTTLDLSGNQELEYLLAYTNSISTIDVTGNPNLISLEVDENQLSEIDLSQNQLLEELYIRTNQLTSLDLTYNAALNYLVASENPIEGMDLSQNPLLEVVHVEDANLRGFNIANGNNEILDELLLRDNPNLTCITVNDVAYAEANLRDEIDAGMSFSTSCPNFANDILTFSFSEILGDAMINTSTHTVIAEAIAGTDISSLSPDITISEAAVISPTSGAVQDFTSPVTYTVTAEDGSAQDWQITIFEGMMPPTNISLSSSSIDENSAPGSSVGMLNTEDQNLNDTFTYTLVSGDGDDDNSAFQISDDQLLNEGNLDFETKSSYNIRIQTDDNNGGTFEKAFVININDVNEAPSLVELSNNSIDESNPVGTLIGIISTQDEDTEDSHTYTVSEACTVCDPLPLNELPFTIVGNELRSNSVLDFETQSNYSIEITSTDQGGLTETEGFVIIINDLPASITALTLSENTIDENEDTGSLVGSLSTFGEDLSGSFTYELVSGTGSDDNASFSISGDQLLTTSSFDFEAQNSYSIRLKTDDGSLTREETFTITINDVLEAPTDIILSANSIAENNAIGDLVGSLSAEDQGVGETLSFSMAAGTGDTDNASFSVMGSELQAAEVFDFETKESYAIRLEVNDGNGGTFQKEFTITIQNANESILVANQLEDQTVVEGFGTIEIDLSNVFVDTDNDALTYEVTSSNTAAVTVGISVTTLTLTEVGLGTSTITVTADDGSGSTTSDQFDIVVEEAPLGFDDQIEIEIYPNPATSFVNINSNEEATIYLIDLRGQTIKSATGRSVRMDVSDLAAGVYTLKITDGKSTLSRRIIKTN